VSRDGLVALACCALSAACINVPRVAFIGADAGADADASTAGDARGAADVAAGTDGTTEADQGAADAGRFDAGALDGGPLDAGAFDAGVHDATAQVCPNAAPPGAAACCDTVPCRGTPDSCDAECTNCKHDCAGQTCCLDGNGNYHGCAATPAMCP
jgi:hypothetical protein